MIQVAHVHADALECTPDYFRMFHVLITDPPYSKHVHASAMSHHVKDGNVEGKGVRKRELGFGHLSPEARAQVGVACAHVTRWGIVYSDVEDSHLMRDAGRVAGAEYLRTMPWVRYSMPQFSGDRPSQGFEHVLLFHNAEAPKSWNGASHITRFDGESDAEIPNPELAHLCLRGAEKHKAEKPLDQLLDLVSWFTEPGENVLDLFGGRATTALACKILGRNCVSLELNPEEVEKGNERLLASSINQPLWLRDYERVRRYIETDKEPTAKVTEGPAQIRAAARARDKQLAREFLERSAAA